MTTPTRPDCFEFAMSFLGDPEETELRSYIEALEARAALAQPEPVGPTDEELLALAVKQLFVASDGTNPWQEDADISDEVVEYARAVLQRWGRPAITPIPISERLPGPEDCDAEGCCWWWRIDGVEAHWELISLGDPIGHNESCAPHVSYGPWLPFHALPLPRQPAADASAS